MFEKLEKGEVTPPSSPSRPNEGCADDKAFWDRVVKTMMEAVEFAGKKANPFDKEKPGKPVKPGKQA